MVPSTHNASKIPPTTNWYVKVLEIEEEARRAEKRHDAIMDEQRKVISTFITRPTTHVPLTITVISNTNAESKAFRNPLHSAKLYY